MIERYRVEAWVNRNLWPGGLEEDFEAIVDDIMECGSDNEEDFEAIVDEITAVIMRRSGL